MPDLRLLLKLGISAATSGSTREFYDRISPFYDLLFTDHLVHVQRMATLLNEEFAGRGRIRALDLGCGTGALTGQLEGEGFWVAGLDFSFRSLRRLDQNSRITRLVQADAAVLPFSSASFDVVTCMGAWRHFRSPRQVLKEICRVLRDDGVFIVGYFPPRLGGLVRVPRGRFGKLLVLLYRGVIQSLNYDDTVDQETSVHALHMIQLAFSSHRIIYSGKNEYLIFAKSRNEKYAES